MSERRDRIGHARAHDGERAAPRAGSACGAIAVVLALGGAGGAGCGEGLPGEGHDRSASPEERVAEGAQALTSAQACVTIQRQGASGTVFDAQIADKLPPKNYGASGTMNAGSLAGVERQSLVRFDMSAIPTGANTNIIGTSLNLAIGQTGVTGPGTIDVHRVTAPWIESEVTWPSFNGAFDPAIEGTMSNGAAFLVTNIRDLVAGWVSQAVPNHGVLLQQTGGDNTNLWTSEGLSVSSRPSLVVCYTVTCDPDFADCNNDGLDGCETDLTNTAAHCGACGAACSVPNAAASCVNGACGLGACNAGYYDCDGDPQNGCEATSCGGVCPPGQLQAYASPVVLAGDITSPGVKDGQGAAAGFGYVLALRVDPTNGNIIALDGSGVRIVTPGGLATTWMTGSVPGYANAGIDSAGNLWFASSSSELTRVTPAGAVAQVTLSQSLPNITSLNVGPDDHVYIGYYAGRPVGCSTPSAPDCGGLAKVDTSTGQLTVLFENNTVSVPTDLAIDANLNVYMADVNYQHIHKFDPTIGQDAIWKSAYALGIAVDASGNVYANGVKYAPDGAQIGQGFYASYGIAVDTAENVYVPKGDYTPTGWAFEIDTYPVANAICQ